MEFMLAIGAALGVTALMLLMVYIAVRFEQHRPSGGGNAHA